jgi:hypothetical protein
MFEALHSIPALEKKKWTELRVFHNFIDCGTPSKLRIIRAVIDF